MFPFVTVFPLSIANSRCPEHGSDHAGDVEMVRALTARAQAADAIIREI